MEFVDGKIIYSFTMPYNTIDGKLEFVKDKSAERKYKEEVYQTVKRKNGQNDSEASMFHWMLERELITLEQFDTLSKIRILRNKIVHELDSFLCNGFPLDINESINKLIEIRKYATKQWYINVELPTSGDAELDDDGNIIIPDEVYSNVDLSFDMLFNAIFK